MLIIIWTASSEFGTYRLCEQRRFRRACASAQSRQNLRCSLIQAVSQEEPSDRKPDPWPLWMAGHAQLKFVMTECSKTQIAWRGSFIIVVNKYAWFILKLYLVKRTHTPPTNKNNMDFNMLSQIVLEMALRDFRAFIFYTTFSTYESRLMTKPTKWLCAKPRLRSAWASAQSDQSLRCALNG